MVTGDHPATALGIARELGLAATEGDMLTGKQLEAINLDDPAGREDFDRTSVFARVTPLQKLMIVEAFNRQGHFTAVTGDGVNDAPALRKAHIGVAMGTGTDVAKEAAEIVLTDDDFTTLVVAIREGRTIFQNLKNVILSSITSNIGELSCVCMGFVGAAAGYATDTEGEVEPQGSGGDRFDVANGPVAELHDGAGPELALDLRQGHLEGLLVVLTRLLRSHVWFRFSRSPAP